MRLQEFSPEFSFAKLYNTSQRSISNMNDFQICLFYLIGNVPFVRYTNFGELNEYLLNDGRGKFKVHVLFGLFSRL